MNDTKDLSNIEKSWKTLLDQLSPSGNDFKMFAIKPRKDAKYFNAKVEGQQIVVDVARTHGNSSDIKVQRRIGFKEFQCVASKYNQYVAGVKGIRPQIRDECGLNSSYLITLIHHLL